MLLAITGTVEPGVNKKTDINRIYYFIRIIDAGNISRAAELLAEPKAKLSRELALLEQEMGVQLVYRTTRQFRLTEEGQQFYQHAKGNIEGLLQSVAALQHKEQGLSGKLKITAPDDLGTYLITRLVDDFARLHPAVEFELIYTNELMDLVKHGIDVAVRIGHLKDSSVIQKKAGHIELILVAAETYLKQIAPLSDIHQLEQLRTIGFIQREWQLYAGTQQVKLKPDMSFTANNFIAVRELAIRGHGIAFLPRFICEEQLASGALKQVMPQWGDHGLPVQLVIPQQKHLSPKNRAFFDYLAQRLNAHFSGSVINSKKLM